MTDGLTLDIYVEMTAPRVQMKVEEGPDNRLEVLIGAPYPSQAGENSAVHLWFRRPQAVIDLGEQLVQQGQMFLEQCRVKASEETGRRMDLAALLDDRRRAGDAVQEKAVATEPAAGGVVDG
jgi:hypothetical protein